ncbi:ATP-binding protein [Streptomyces sp. SID8381]|uniref:ATP-binding protein n=1 Tax=unclassified Streptomyces TaxID=2593676 RepID=UPI00037BD387|nr:MULTISPECIES: ATP-binding protein [unclassified Streptomyces]MYX26733.1 ATP-binding protein [Streptomyces sp. SID8381]
MATPASTEFPARGMVPAVAAMRQALRDLKAGTLDTSDFKPLPDELKEKAREDGYAVVRQQAWTTSLRLANHESYAHWTLDRIDADEQHRDRLRDYVTALSWALRKGVAPPKLNGIAYGNTGSGKTTAIIAAGNYAVQSGLRTRYLKHTQYLEWLRPNRAPAGQTEQEVIDLYTTSKTQLLILDEVCSGMDNPSDWARTQSEHLIDARRAAGLPTLAATNLTSDRIIATVGSRFFSRLAGGASLFEILGEDRRCPVSWGGAKNNGTAGITWG